MMGLQLIFVFVIVSSSVAEPPLKLYLRSNAFLGYYQHLSNLCYTEWGSIPLNATRKGSSPADRYTFRCTTSGLQIDRMHSHCQYRNLHAGLLVDEIVYPFHCYRYKCVIEMLQVNTFTFVTSYLLRLTHVPPCFIHNVGLCFEYTETVHIGCHGYTCGMHRRVRYSKDSGCLDSNGTCLDQRQRVWYMCETTTCGEYARYSLTKDSGCRLPGNECMAQGEQVNDSCTNYSCGEYGKLITKDICV